jgi:hypothetical protein
MAVSAQWKFVLANSSDLTGQGELKNARNRTLQLVHNRPGALSFSLPLDDDLSAQIWPITSAVKAYRRGSNNAWSLIWSGMVWSLDEDVSGNNLQVNVQGWLQWLAVRMLRRAKSYTDINPATGSYWTDAEIILDLVAEGNTTPIPWDGNYAHPSIYTVTDAGVSGAMPTPVGRGAQTGSFHPTHERRYPIAIYANLLSEIQRLTDLENGCDVLVDPSTRALGVWDQKMTDRPAALFGYNAGTRNLQQFGRQLDPSSMVNYLVATGQSGSITPQFADTRLNPAPTQNPPKLGENAMTTYGLMEQSVSLSDAKSANILGVYAGAEVLLRSSPRVLYTMTPLPFTLTLGPGRVPEPFVDYTLGDKVYLSAKYKGRFQIDKQGIRVFGMTVRPDDNGNEILDALQVSPT